MVAAPLGHIWNYLRDDTLAFLARPPVAPYLRVYEITCGGSHSRLHLRAEADGSGILFVNCNQAIHLTAAATELARWALDGVPERQAELRLRRRHARPEVRKIYQMISRLTNLDGCPVCGMEDGVELAPPFSTPVSAPYKADIALTYGCNNVCSHCYNAPSHKGMDSLPLTGWKRVLSLVREKGIPQVIFTGGEPTLHPELPELIRHARSLGLTAGLNSNGRRFSQMAYARQICDAGLDHLQITVCSNRPSVHDELCGPGSFQQTTLGIRNAIDAGIHTITNTTLTRKNRDHISELLRFLHGLGVRTFAMNGMIHAGGGIGAADTIPEEDLAPLLVLARDTARQLGMTFLWYSPTEYCRMNPIELEIGAKRCNAGQYSICIEPNGDVLPCQSFYSAAGNILRDPWDRIWDSKLFLAFRERKLPAKCDGCPDAAVCGGGCPMGREQ